MLLDGPWEYDPAPPDRFWDRKRGDGWRPVIVPGEPAMQGFDVQHDREAAYRVALALPEEWTGVRVIVRFEGVYDAARAWIDGVLVGEHVGGFTRFDVDVTAHVRPGGTSQLVVGVTDRWESTSLANRYADHVIGGILRPVHVLALAPTHVSRLHHATALQSDGSAFVTVDLELDGPDADDAQVHLSLLDPDDRLVFDSSIPAGSATRSISIPVAEPLLWTAETPYLYYLNVALRTGQIDSAVSRRVGIRTVQRLGNELLVNGRPIALRGVNHHDIHATLGRCTDGFLDRADLELFAEANINFVRTSHYPPHPGLLDAADELGIYIEVENAVCWADQFGWPATQDDPQWRAEYLSQLAEMVERDRDHPSVIIWSLGNESTWGENFAAELEHLRAADPSRPVIMSFPGGPEDIVSSHYPPYGKLGSLDRPIIHDEAAHCPVYQYGDLRRDPAIRLDYADTLRAFTRDYSAMPGNVGMAIWAGVDEVFQLPGGTRGYGPWGIVDVWRRRKPEWWAVKKAYSPIRIDASSEPLVAQHGRIRLPLDNLHDFVSLSDFTVTWSLGQSTVRQPGPPVAPRSRGVLELPVGEVTGPLLSIEVRNQSGRLIDRYEFLAAGVESGPLASWSAGAPAHCHPTANALVITAGEASFEVDRRTGTVRGSVGGQTLVHDGPRLHLEGAILADWSCESVTHERVGDSVVVHIDGQHGSTQVEFVLTFGPGETLATAYRASGPAPNAPRGVKEAGISFTVDPSLTTSSWVSDPSWLAPPADHLGRAVGSATQSEAEIVAYPERPGGDWRLDRWDPANDDVPDPHGWAFDYRARRPRLRTLHLSGTAGTVCVTSDGAQSARLFPVTDVVRPTDSRVHRSGRWQKESSARWPEPFTGYGFDEFSLDADARVSVRFTGSGIEWVAGRGPHVGLVDVELDGELVRSALDPYQCFESSERVIFAARDLPPGDHVLTIRSTGKANRAATASALVLDHFVVYPAAPYPIALAVLDEVTFPVTMFDWIDPALRHNAAAHSEMHGFTRLRLSARSENCPHGAALR